MRIAATGFVSAREGSIAGANALLLGWLLDAGQEITFFSKPSFVDPREAVGNHPGLHFVATDNRVADRMRRGCERIPGMGLLARRVDAASYNRMVVAQMRRHHAHNGFDCALWMGDYARGRIEGVPAVSFVQGAPGSDARSIFLHFHFIRELAGWRRAFSLLLLGALRLSPAGRPPFGCTDRFVVGSNQSRAALEEYFGIGRDKTFAIPYPVDLEQFRPGSEPPEDGPLRCLWLGRMAPRKRLDLFLDGAGQAIYEGADLQLTIVGRPALVPELANLIAKFPYQDRLTWVEAVARREVPALLRRHDLLVQPSEEEDFGSSVAEAQACGLRVVVGATNGNRDYLGPYDTALEDYRPETLAAVLRRACDLSHGEFHQCRRACRDNAEKHFHLSRIGPKLLDVLQAAHAK